MAQRTRIRKVGRESMHSECRERREMDAEKTRAGTRAPTNTPGPAEARATRDGRLTRCSSTDDELAG